MGKKPTCAAKYCLVSVLLCAGAPILRAQDPRVAVEPRANPTSSSTGHADRIRVDANLVLIPVVVTDHSDRMITGLERENFQLYEGKAQQVITHFASEDAPVSIALLFDCSGSMGGKLEKSRAAVKQFLRISNPEDEFALIQFNDRAELIAGFSTGTEEIQNRLMFLAAKGRTALLDAVYLAISQMRYAKHPRKAIIIVSDGGDNASRYTAREVKNRVREADVQVYSIGILEPVMNRQRTLEEMSGPALLDEIAQQSGGRLFEVNDLNELPDIAIKIGASLRHQYVLGYAPPEANRDGKYHKIRVKVTPPKGVPRLRTTFRPGYIAPGN